ncbi:MAG: GIDE domain-containing protein [Haloferacaceae archaeon]
MVTDLVAVPVVLVTLGFVGVYTGWKRRRIHARMAAAEATPVRELASPGVVEVEGEAVPAGEPVTAPVTGRDAVVAAWTVEEWDERGDTSRWREVARGIEASAFEVDDGTAAVRVEPVSRRDTAGKWTQTTGVSAADGVRVEDVLAEFETFPTEAEVAPDEDPPEGIRRLHDDHGLYEDTGSITNAVDVGRKHGRRRYAEQVIRPGDEAYVLGRVEARDDPDRTRFRPAEAAVTVPDDGPLVLSDQSEASIEAEFESAARTLLVAGAVSTLVGVGGLAYLLLPL